MNGEPAEFRNKFSERIAGYGNLIERRLRTEAEPDCAVKILILHTDCF